MADFTNIVTGLNVPSQIPLNIKEYVENEQILKNLSTLTQRAFTYHKGLKIHCLLEKTNYEWQEVLPGFEDTGLLIQDYEYPNNIISFGIDYSNKKYNFFPLSFRKIKTNNSGITGESILKPEIENLNDITITAKKITSNSLILSSTIDEINIEIAELGIPNFIVNSDYTGTIELGTQAKPFKTLQKALDAYVGTGISNKVPQFLGREIIVQKHNPVFTGSLLYSGLKLTIENNVQLQLESVQDYIINMDSEAVLPSNPNYSMLPFSNSEQVTIIINLGFNSVISTSKKILKNRGTNSLILNQYKQLIINGEKGFIQKLPEINVTNPSTESIFSINENNLVGFTNTGNPQLLSNTNIISNNSKIFTIGQSGIAFLNNCNIRFGVNGVPFNSDTIPIELNGGRLNCIQSGGSVDFQNEFNNYPTYYLKNWITMQTTGAIGSIFEALNCSLGRVSENFIKNLDSGGTTQNQISLKKCFSFNILYDSFIKNVMSSGIWTVSINDCEIIFWNVDQNKVKIATSSKNTLQQQLVESLEEYPNKASAITAGLFKGCNFTRFTNINAGNFVIGEEYKITTIGTTNFTLIGATSNTLGLYFTATGVGTGTGVGTKYVQDIVV